MSAVATTSSITIPSVHYLAILPVIILFGASLALVFATALVRDKIDQKVATSITSVASVAVLVVTYFQWRCLDKAGPSTSVAHAIVLDGFSVVATAVIALSLLMATLVAHDWAVRERVVGAEYQILALAASAGAVLMTQANDLIVIFLGLEILSLGLYVLVAFDRHRRTSSEAALKYFLLGGFASAIFIYGAALVYGATGTTNLTSISYFLAANTLAHPGLLYAGGALLLVGFAFKVAAVPFHLWSPDVYEGAPTPVTGFMASIVKVGAFAAFVRVIISALGTRDRDLAANPLGTRGVNDGRGGESRPDPEERQADARLFLDQSRRVHPARHLGGQHSRCGGDLVLPRHLRAHGRGDLRHRHLGRGTR